MNEELTNALSSVVDTRTLFIVCSILIFADVLTGYLKAFKNKKLNSSISRDGYIKKIGWVMSLMLGLAMDYFIHVHIFLVGTALVCVATEGISVYENLSEVGVHLPFARYFEKVKDKVDDTFDEEGDENNGEQ